MNWLKKWTKGPFAFEEAAGAWLERQSEKRKNRPKKNYDRVFGKNVSVKDLGVIYTYVGLVCYMLTAALVIAYQDLGFSDLGMLVFTRIIPFTVLLLYLMIKFDFHEDVRKNGI